MVGPIGSRLTFRLFPVIDSAWWVGEGRHQARSAPTLHDRGNAEVRKILVTGSEGLVGTALSAELRARGVAVAGLDLKLPAGHPGRADVADGQAVEQLEDGCGGIVHLAAVSRVVWAERDPERCWRINVDGTRNVLRAARGSQSRLWVLFASSREVYGEPTRLPVAEDAALRPMNVYGRSKAAGEDLVGELRDSGLTTAILRFSNVYGSTDDHPTGWCRRSRAVRSRVRTCGSTAAARPSTSPTSTTPSRACSR